MFFEFGWRVWASIAAFVTLIAVGLYLLDALPWWGIIIAVPFATAVGIAVLSVVGIVAWMSSGSH